MAWYDESTLAKFQIGENVVMIWDASDPVMVNIRNIHDNDCDGLDVELDMLKTQLGWLDDIIKAQPKEGGDDGLASPQNGS